MNILIVGEGGREHALAWKAAQSELVETIFVAPGNAGTAQESKTHNVKIAVNDIAGLIEFSRKNNVRLCIVGPEGPLVLGITDAFTAAGINCFGPAKAAARLEGSKSFAKEFLLRHRIPTAAYATFSELQPAIEYIKAQGVPIVIKADGLAAGKGVIIAHTETQAIAALEDMLDHSLFGVAGASVVIEAFLEGEEASFMCMVADGRVLPFASSQDHKAAYDGDKGPNTGGMGAYSPAAVVDSAMFQKIMTTVIEPTITGLQQDGLSYTGFLYAGLMIDAQGVPRVIEYNCRMGDPETQPIMMRLESDLVDLCLAAFEDRLPSRAEWTDQVALGVVLAAEGYPGEYKKGRKIKFKDTFEINPDQKVFHAGTRLSGEDTLTNGGRVLCVCARADSTSAAQQQAYRLVKGINWPGMWFRKDIAYRAVDREQV